MVAGLPRGTGAALGALEPWAVMRSRILTVAYFLGCSALLLWPALYNGYPFLFPDSVGYLASGNKLALALLGNPPGEYGERSEFYSASIFVLHLRASLWPPALGAALLSVWSVDRLLRSLLPTGGRRERARILVILAVFTSLSWRVSMIMPDYLAGLIIIWVALLIANPPSLSPKERFVVGGFLWYGAVSHGSHLLLLGGITVVLTILRQKGWRSLWLILIAACLSQMTLHKILYGQAKLFGHGPPFLLARVLADGTGAPYGRKHPEYTVSQYVELAEGQTEEHILWEERGLALQVQKRAPEDWAAIRQEEKKFVLGAVLARPILQLRASTLNFLTQLSYVGLGVEYNNHPIIESWIHTGIRRGDTLYEPTLQRKGRLPTKFFSVVQIGILLLSLGFLGFRGRAVWAKLSKPHRTWVALAFGGIILNAAITGMISGAFARYQSRVIWLIPLAAVTVRAAEGQDRESAK